MFLTSISKNYIQKILGALGVVCLYALLAHSASAQATVVELTVNGGNTASITNGQDVDLAWYIQGSVSSCSINNGVGAIDVSGLPSAVSGSLTVTPPEGETVNYTLTCTGGSGGSSEVIISLEPIVTMSISEDVVDFDIFAEEAEEVTVEWNSQYATECSTLWLESSLDPGVQIWTKTNNITYEGPGQTSGSVRFSDDSWNSQPDLLADTTFYITCTNVTTGAETTESISLSVNDPQPLPPPTVDLFTENGNTVGTRNEDRLWATVPSHLHFDARYTDSCTFSAFYLDDGTEYDELPGDMERHGNPTYKSYGEFYWIQIWEDTIFRADCTQRSYELAGVTYPATTTFDELVITIDVPLDLPIDPVAAGLEQVTVDITLVTPPAEINPATGYSQTGVTVSPRNADRCEYTAVHSDDGPTHVHSWGGTNGSGGSDQSRQPLLTAGTTTLIATCYRFYETTFFTPADPEYYYGYATSSLEVFVPNVVAVVPDPAVYIYTGAIDHGAEYVNDNYITEEGFQYKYSNGIHRMDAGAAHGKFDSATVTFPFSLDGESEGPYDIHVSYCDASNGFHDFTLTTSGGFTTTWRSDSTLTLANWCGDRRAIFSERVGTGVSIADGETITVSCNNGADTIQREACWFEHISFGPTDSSVVTAELSTTTGFVNTNVLWAAENVDECRDDDALTAGGVSYQYAAGEDERIHLRNLDIATTTTFSIECFRSSGETEDASTVLNIIGPEGEEVIEVETIVASGQCLDALGGGGSSAHDVHGPSSDGFEDNRARDLVAGERANPVDGTCEPSIDLAADQSAIGVSTLGDGFYNRTTGLWNDVVARLRILNLGDGAYVATTSASIPYNAYFTFDPIYISTFSGITSPLRHPDAVSYTNTIPAPTVPNNIATAEQSDPISQTFDTGIPFGDHQLCAEVNQAAGGLYTATDLYPENDTTGFVNNTACAGISLPMLAPPMTLDVDRSLIRSGDSVTVSWSAETAFPLTCTVNGPGISTTFDASDSYPGPTVGNQSSGPLQSKSEYTLTCIENITANNYTFTVSADVEIVPKAEEI